jgi:hypothetical protein
MLKMLEKRIYVISIGFKSDWILKSIRRLRPDFVYILEDKNEKDKKYFKAKKEIIKELKNKDVLYGDIKCDKEDEYALLKLIKPIIESHSKDKIFLNLCSGDRKIPAMFIMVSFLFRSINKQIYLVSYNALSEELIEFPSFTVKLPDPKIISVLNEISRIRGDCTKKKLRKHITHSKSF